MTVVERKLTEIKPYERNPRRNDDAVKYVKRSIEEFGFKVPIVIDKEGTIVAGHTRYKAAKQLKMKTVPCVIADDLTEEQIRAFRLADNKTAEFAEWDFPLLNEELMALCSFKMPDFGFEIPDLFPKEEEKEKKEAKEDGFDVEGEVEAIVKRGEIYRLGDHILMCADATSDEDVARLMKDDRADLIFTDPPYNVDYSSKNKFLNEADEGNRIQRPIENDAFTTDEEIGELLWKPAFSNMREYAKDDASIYVTMPQGGAHMMMMMMMKSSWQVKHELIWVKNNHVLGRTDYFYKHEPIMYGWAEKHHFYGKGEFNKSVWEIPKPQKSDLHPTMKPIRLIANCLLNSSKEKDIVLDLFGGSGSTLIACEQFSRRCRMMELDPKYCDVIIKRWEQFTGKRAEKLT